MKVERRKPHEIEHAGDGVHLSLGGVDLSARAVPDLIDLERPREDCAVSCRCSCQMSPSSCPEMADLWKSQLAGLERRKVLRLQMPHDPL